MIASSPGAEAAARATALRAVPLRAVPLRATALRAVPLRATGDALAPNAAPWTLDHAL